MRCDCCPLYPTADDDVCAISESEYGIEHSDGMLGCKHSWNWCEKKANEYGEHLGDMGTDMGLEMTFSESNLQKIVELCKHTIGLDYKKPYHRHGKAFYKPYRNYYGGNEETLLNKMPDWLVNKAKHNNGGIIYSLTPSGLEWLGRRLNITIKQGD